MEFVKKLDSDMITSMKEGKKLRLTVLREIKAGMKQANIDQKKEMNDELLIEVPVDELDAVKELVVNEMKHAADLKVELDVGIMHGNNWLEAH